MIASSRVPLPRAFARERADVVIVDDASTPGGAEPVVEGLRYAPGGDDVELLVLGGDHSSARLEEPRARARSRGRSTRTSSASRSRASASRIAERRARARPCATR